MGAQGRGVGCLRQLPEFGDEQAVEPGMRGEADKAGASEGVAPGRDATDAEAGEQAKGSVEAGDEEAEKSGTEGSARGDIEFGNDPERAGRETRTKAGDEGIGLRGGEAVEEKVGGDEVVVIAGGGSGAEVGAAGGEAAAGSGAGGSCGEAAEHGGAGVDGMGVQGGMGGEEAGEEAAVTVAEDEGMAGGGELRDEAEAAALEKGAEGEVFPGAVDGGNAIEAAWVRHRRFIGGGGGEAAAG